MNETEIKGLVLEIQRMSTEDGPGLRTTVFLKGCTLKCSWCHNPESISSSPEIHWIQSSCINCRICLETCRDGALSKINEEICINRTLCSTCGDCISECPPNALEMLGQIWGVKELAAELIKDQSYFEESGGGVTISGGEALMQAEFTEALLKELKTRGIHTALDTCGMFNTNRLLEILKLTDLVLFDLKEMDLSKHKEYTGADYKKILENFKLIADFRINISDSAELWLRTPIIPGATARVDNIKLISEFLLNGYEDAISKWELCAFNNLCKDKYTRLDMTWLFADSPLMKTDEMDELVKAAVSTGIKKDKIIWTGMTQKKEMTI